MKKEIKVCIINLGINNLHSIYNACLKAGYSTRILEEKEKLKGDIAILPGIGSFSSGMLSIKKKKIKEKITEYLSKPNSFLYGICLGMQLLFKKSFEFKKTDGLGLIDGEVKKINSRIVPHMGWNTLKFKKKKFHIKKFINTYFYFVHSYICHPKNHDNIFASTCYDKSNFCSIVKKKNIFGTQFHPEKSGLSGIKFLKSLKKFLD